MSRLVLIDDTDPSIQYSGPWFEVNDAQIDTGFQGPPFQNTLHGVNDTANFSFSFSGSAVIVYGTVIMNNSWPRSPTWECFIDNISIGSSPLPPSESSENNQILCGAGPSQFEDGPHLLTVNASILDQRTFWFDQIQYAPSANVSLNQSLLRIDSHDLAIQYSPGWQSMDALIPGSYYNVTQVGNSSFTQTTGANLTYQFSGANTSISLFGSTKHPSGNFRIALATYAVDDQDPMTFPVQSHSDIISDLSNQMLFDTGQLSPGQHTLVVKFLGDDSTLPFQFNYIVQRNGPPPSTSSITPTSTSVSSTNSSHSHRKHTEAIICGVLGGLLLTSLLLTLFFIRIRNNRRSQILNEKSYTIATPFTLPPSNPKSTFLSDDYSSYTSIGQSLPYLSDSEKFSHKRKPSDSTSSNSSPTLTPLRRQPPSTELISHSSPPIRPLRTGSQTNFDDTPWRTRFMLVATDPSMQRPRGANAIFIRHADSGVRIPSHAEDDLVELLPLYASRNIDPF